MEAFLLKMGMEDRSTIILAMISSQCNYTKKTIIGIRTGKEVKQHLSVSDMIVYVLEKPKTVKSKIIKNTIN